MSMYNTFITVTELLTTFVISQFSFSLSTKAFSKLNQNMIRYFYPTLLSTVELKCWKMYWRIPLNIHFVLLSFIRLIIYSPHSCCVSFAYLCQQGLFHLFSYCWCTAVLLPIDISKDIGTFKHTSSLYINCRLIQSSFKL